MSQSIYMVMSIEVAIAVHLVLLIKCFIFH